MASKRRRGKGTGTPRARNKTSFKPGDPRINRNGRPKGSPNKFSGELKQLVLDALANAHKDGAEAYLKQQAKKNSRSFMQLIAKLLPTQLTGKDDGPIEVLVNKAMGGLSNLSDKELAQLQTLLVKAGVVTSEKPA